MTPADPCAAGAGQDVPPITGLGDRYSPRVRKSSATSPRCSSDSSYFGLCSRVTFSGTSTPAGSDVAHGRSDLSDSARRRAGATRSEAKTRASCCWKAPAPYPCAADFNMTLTVPAWSLGEPRTYRSARKGGEEENALLPFEEVVEQRIVSLSPVGLKRPRGKKLRHLTRGVYELDEPVIDPDDPDRPKGPLPRRKWWLPYPPWTKLAAPRGSKTSAGAPAAATPAAVASPASER